MKVIIPVIDKEEGDAKVANDFRIATSICISQSNKKELEWIPANELNTGNGDFSDDIKRLGIYAIISGSMAPTTVQIFARNKVEVFKAKGTDISENIIFFQNNQLELLTAQEAREMQACDSSCNSCSSTSCN